MGVSAQLKIAVDDAQKHKLSMTTEMFINELNDGGFDPVKQAERRRARRALLGKEVFEEIEPHRCSKNDGRFYAAPDTINGRAYVSAFITLEDNNDVSALEALGVKVQCKFEKGIITSEIPVDKLSEVAVLDDVSRISVARVLKPATNLSRKCTNVDDILTQSVDAIRAGIDNKYDGKGVLLGVIDRGIDFQHIAFKDKDGISRIVGGYIWDGNNQHDYSVNHISEAETDNTNEDHGTHTASTAGGSSVIIDGSTVTVTDEHDKATYGGMAPGASLFLCGLNEFFDTYECNSIYRICNYAERFNMPVVVSNSYGSMMGAHDGETENTEFQRVISQYFNDDKLNHICLFSTGNESNMSKDGEGGGKHIFAKASPDEPLGSILRCNSYKNRDGGYYYRKAIADIWTRTRCQSGLKCTIYVLDATTGIVLSTIPVNEWGEVNISNYYNGNLYVNYYDFDNKQNIFISTADVLSTKGVLDSYNSKYTLAFEVSPVEGDCLFDIWAGDGCYLSNYLDTSGHGWISGSDDMSVCEKSTYPNVISVGAYVSRVVGTDYKGNMHSLINKYYVDDIAPFSGYATVDQSPTGKFYPWITAPGTCVISAVNHYHTSGYYLGNDEHQEFYRVNNNTTNPYGTMSGTSMACPVAAGIVALWLQAAKEVGTDLTTSDVKRIMAETAIKDGYVTDGDNSSHFGNGKIDALAGIAKILREGRKPMIQATPSELSFDGPINESQSQTINVKGLYITGNITATLNDESGIYSIDKTNIVASMEGEDITVTWEPTTAGTTTATLTLSAEGVDDVVVNLTGHSDVTSISASIPRVVLSTRVGTEYSQLFRVLGRYLTDDITLTITGDSHAFSVTPTTIYKKNSGKPIDVVVTFSPSSAGSYSGILTLTSNGAETASIILSGTGTDSSTELTRYEYWFDNDIGDMLSGSISGYEADIDINVNTQHLSDGLHTLNIRMKQSGGEYDYSPVSSKVFFKHNKSEGGQVVYWFDDNDINTKAGSTSILEIEEPQLVTLDLSDNDKFPLGFHTLNMRMATRGKSLSNIYKTRVLKTATGDFDRIEYWVDGNFPSQASQRGYVTATSSSGKEFNFENKTINLSNVPSGPHRIYYRAVSSKGITGSAVGMASVFVGGGTPSMIEYWFDGDATKSATVPLPASALQDTVDVALVMSDIEKFPLGFHLLSMRFASEGREQSPVYSARVLKMASGEANRMEYWVDGDYDNRKTVTGKAASSDANSFIFTDPFDLSDVSAGLHCVYYRATSTNGITKSAIYMTPVFVGGGNTTKLKYWFDDENGSGGVQTLSGSADPTDDKVVYFNQTINLDNLSSGVHRLFYRGVNNEGVSKTAVSMTPILVKSMFGGGEAVLSSFTIVVDNVEVDHGALNGENEQLFTYKLDATELSLGNHTLKASFMNSYGVRITEQIPFRVIERPPFIKGDVNNDMKVTITDAVAIVNYILGSPSTNFNEDAADVNEDGYININDAVSIVNMILMQGQ